MTSTKTLATLTIGDRIVLPNYQDELAVVTSRPRKAPKSTDFVLVWVRSFGIDVRWSGRADATVEIVQD